MGGLLPLNVLLQPVWKKISKFYNQHVGNVARGQNVYTFKRFYVLEGKVYWQQEIEEGPHFFICSDAYAGASKS